MIGVRLQLTTASHDRAAPLIAEVSNITNETNRLTVDTVRKDPLYTAYFGRTFFAFALVAGIPASAQLPPREAARRAAIHPVATVADMRAWLARVPVTRAFPPDFAASLRGQAPLFTIEVTTTPGCLPCDDAWDRLATFRARYGWHVRVLGRDEALLRSGRLGLPWVGHPVIWVRPIADPTRIVPIAVGTDHDANLARNAWLAARMLTGLPPQTGLRAMAKFTGIVGASPPATPRSVRR